MVPVCAHPHLFLDDVSIGDSAFLARTWHTPRKFPEPVFTADASGLTAAPVLYGSIRFQDGRFRMWHLNWSRQPRPFAAYAESGDGVHWRRPDLGLFPGRAGLPPHAFLVSKHPDGLIDDLTVIEDPADGEWPLKMLYFDSLGNQPIGGLFAARSRDGIRWERLSEERVLPFGDRFNALPVRLDGRFVVFGRARLPGRSPKGRAVWRTESEDLLTWSEPELVLARDGEDPPDLEIYSLVPFPYGGLLLGGIERMAMSPDRLDTELAWSRDGGRTWSRSRARAPFLAPGRADAFDGAWVNLPANEPVLRDGMLWFFYSGRSGAHYSPFPLNHGGVGLALLRRDGFASLRAGSREGWLLTRPMPWPEGGLWVNADTRRDLEAHPAYGFGRLEAEVLEEGKPVPGFTRADGIPFTGNTIRQPGGYAELAWKDGRRLESLAGRTLQLRFFLRDAHLYAFRAGPPPA